MSAADAATATRLDAEEMIRAARQTAGLTEFGEINPHESLHRLVESLNTEACLTEAGAMAKRASLIRVLCNRLLLHHEYETHPRIAQERIGSPIVILGLPRSGTTKLQRMIGADPNMQKLPFWRMLYPVRALTTGPGTDRERRIAAAEAFVNAIRERNPAMYAGHPMLALEPDEEYFAMEMSFQAHINTSSFHTPSYGAWLDAQNFDNWYVWLKKFLQFVQWSDGSSNNPWVLKAPHHLAHLPLLLKHFPDATIVHCHRDTSVCIASFCALLMAARQASSHRARPEDIGQYVLHIYGRRIDAYLRDRPAAESRTPFVDVPYADIVNRAAGVIDRCYAATGIELSDASRRAMLAWQAANAQHKHGAHRYSLADYCLTEAEVAARFRHYSARFASHLS
jgi:Sulfotransferase family